jgi:hypothetical protein
MTSSPSPSPTAERMRLHRMRRRRGMRCVRVRLHVTQIDYLIRGAYLEPEHRDDRNEIQRAVEILLSDTFNERGLIPIDKRDA